MLSHPASLPLPSAQAGRISPFQVKETKAQRPGASGASWGHRAAPMATMNLRNMFSKVTPTSPEERELELRRVLAQEASLRFQVCCAALTSAPTPPQAYSMFPVRLRILPSLSPVYDWIPFILLKFH